MAWSYVVLVAVGVVMFVIELRVRARRADRVDLRQAGLSVRIGIIAYSLAGVSQLAVTGLGFWAADHFVTWKMSALNPGVWIAYIVLDDFTGYWAHRAAHRWRVLWSAHLVHHSPTDYAMVNAARLSPVEAMYQPMVTLWAPLMGFPVTIYGPITVAYLLYSEAQHTTIIPRLRWLDSWLATSSNHRVHHGRNPEYLDRNFGTYTVIWDKLFGTYQRETVPVEFGVTDRLRSQATLTVAAGGYPALLRDVRRAPDVGRAIGRLFDPPAAAHSSG